MNDLFIYNYPFYLPNFFQHKLKKHQFEVGLKLFQAFNSLSIEKIISVEEFFKLYPSVLENKEKQISNSYFISGTYDLATNNGHFLIFLLKDTPSKNLRSTETKITVKVANKISSNINIFS